MLYELVAIARKGSLNEVKEVARIAGQTILTYKGVVRKYDYWGEMFLPTAIRKHQNTHHQGCYFVMKFNSSSDGQREMLRVLRHDPRMICCNVIKFGNRFKDVLASLQEE